MRLPRLFGPIITIEDDRGERHILDRRGWISSPSFQRPHTRFVIREAARRIAPGGRAETRMYYRLYVLAVLAVVFGVAFVSAFIRGIPNIAFAIGLPAAVVGFGIVALRLSIRRSAPAGVDIMVRNGLCACCAYDLSGEPASDEAFVVCPECGAAWRRDRMVNVVRSPSPIAPDAHKPRTSSSWFVSKLVDDDRGSRTSLLARRPRELIGPTTNELTRERLDDAQHEVRNLGRGLRIIVTVLCVLLGGLTAVGGIFVTGRIPTSSLSGMMGALGGSFALLLQGAMWAFFGWMLAMGNLGVSPRVARRIMLGHALCPSCSTDLANIEPEADGCRVCPTCGSAWRLNDSPRPIP